MKTVINRKDKIILRITCFFLLYNALTAPKNVEAEINDDTKQQILNVIESLKHLKFPETGKGEALVKLKNKQGDFEKAIAFAFKNEFSRSAIYHLKEDQQGDLERGWAFGANGSLTYSEIGKAVRIQSDKLRLFYRNRENLRGQTPLLIDITR